MARYSKWGNWTGAAATDFLRMRLENSLVLGVAQATGHIPQRTGESSRLIDYANYPEPGSIRNGRRRRRACRRHGAGGVASSRRRHKTAD